MATVAGGDLYCKLPARREVSTENVREIQAGGETRDAHASNYHIIPFPLT